MKKQHSLLGRLTLFISIGLIIIWLTTLFATTHVSLSQNRQRLIEDLSHISTLRVGLINHRFESAERDAQALAHNYDRYHYIPPDNALPVKSESLYFPIDSSKYIPQSKQAQDRCFIQIYGRAGQTYYLDSFVFDRRYGISLLPPREHSADYLTRHLTELRQFPHQQSVLGQARVHCRYWLERLNRGGRR